MCPKRRLDDGDDDRERDQGSGVSCAVIGRNSVALKRQRETRMRRWISITHTACTEVRFDAFSSAPQ
jgi:hypothetical protein